jgi:hypothetical protein
MDPRLCILVAVQLGIGDAARGRHRQRPRQCLANLRRAHGGKRADPALAVAFEIARKAAQAGERSHQRAAADAFGAALGQKRAHVRGRQRREIL